MYQFSFLLVQWIYPKPYPTMGILILINTFIKQIIIFTLDLTRNLFQLHPLPLPPRIICKINLQFKFPKHAVTKWIVTRNDAIEKINNTNEPFDWKLRIVGSLAMGGIHILLQMTEQREIVFKQAQFRVHFND